MTALLCGSLHSHLGSSVPSRGGYIVNALKDTKDYFAVPGVFYCALVAHQADHLSQRGAGGCVVCVNLADAQQF